MHYPWWHVPLLTAPMLIAAISVIHVVVSHYAVGGGLFLAVETSHAYRTGDRKYLAYLRSHAWFFVLITVVFGAITGVGIWWTIGLASPLATEMLIHIFVFGWAIEYVFFVIEIAAAFIFYYFWGRLDPGTHVTIGWIYAGAAWISLVLITGITAFMLNPGGWVDNQNFWVGFLNPQFLPQTLARTGGALLLASLYVYAHASFKCHDSALRDKISRRSARPALLGAALVTAGGLGWFAFLPPSARAALEAAAPLNMLMLIIFALTVAIFALLYFGPYRNPGWLSPGFGILFLGCGFAVVGAGEFVREAVRKPYVSYNVVLSNQVLADNVPAIRQAGYLESGTWTRAYVYQRYPQVMAGQTVDERLLAGLGEPEQLDLGRVLFMYHCNDCHAADGGLSALHQLQRGWDEDYLNEVVRHPERIHFFMPPWCGTEEEAQLLVKYLKTITPDYPAGMHFGGAPVGE
jgi:mono/diheme cytochrome c family protein